MHHFLGQAIKKKINLHKPVKEANSGSQHIYNILLYNPSKIFLKALKKLRQAAFLLLIYQEESLFITQIN